MHSVCGTRRMRDPFDSRAVIAERRITNAVKFCEKLLWFISK